MIFLFFLLLLSSLQTYFLLLSATQIFQKNLIILKKELLVQEHLALGIVFHVGRIIQLSNSTVKTDFSIVFDWINFLDSDVPVLYTVTVIRQGENLYSLVIKGESEKAHLLYECVLYVDRDDIDCIRWVERQ